MANFPTSKDTFSTHVLGDIIDPAFDNAQQSAIVALEDKVGIDSSADTTTLDYKLKNTSSVNPGHKHTLSSSGFSDVDMTGLADGNLMQYSTGAGNKWIPATTSAPDASTSVKGVTKMSVAPVSATSPIAVGDNDGRVPTQGENDALVGDNIDVSVGTGNKFVTQTGLQHNAEKYAADVGSNDTYVITLSPAPTSYTNGMVVHFKANTVNTGAATLNINSLGAKTIVKGVNTTLDDGDISAGQLCTVIYDGTNFVLQNIKLPSALYRYVSTEAGSSIAIYTTAAQTIFTRNIPANTLKVGSSIKTKTAFSWGSATYATQNWKVELKFGGTVLSTVQLSTTGNGQNDFWYGSQMLDVTLNCTSTSAQAGMTSSVAWNLYQNNAGTNSFTTYTSPMSMASSAISSSIDITTSKDLTLEYTRITNGNGGTLTVGTTLVEYFI